MIAFVCTAVPSLLLTKMIGKHLESLYVMGVSLLWAAWSCGSSTLSLARPRTVSRHMTERMEDVSMFQAIWIGICQVASAVFPGTSRSMSTIAAGQVAGMSRTAALEFSFFLSMPTMIAATGYDLLHTFHPRHGEAAWRMPADAHEWIVLIIGFVVSFIVALAVVAWFMNWVRRRGIHAVRHLPDRRRHRCAGLGDERVASSNFPILAALRVSVVQVFGFPITRGIGAPACVPITHS